MAGHMSPAVEIGLAGLGSPVQNSGCSGILIWVSVVPQHRVSQTYLGSLQCVVLTQ